MTRSESSIRPSNINNGSTVEHPPEGVNDFFRSVPTGCFPESLGMPTKAQRCRSLLAGVPEQTFHSKPRIAAKRGGRRGPLSSESKEHAQTMRRHRACVRCRLLKVKVSI